MIQKPTGSSTAGRFCNVCSDSLWVHDDFADGAAAVQKFMGGAGLLQWEVFADIRSDVAAPNHVEAFRGVRQPSLQFVIVDVE